LYFFLIVFCSTKLINLKKYFFFDFDNRKANIRDTIKTRYIIVVEQKYLTNSDKRFKKR